MSSLPRSGYTLPVFACAAAVAALRRLQQMPIDKTVSVNLIQPPEVAKITIEQVAKLSDQAALAISRSDPGDNLDLTRNTPIWAMVAWASDQPEPIQLLAGEGVGRLTDGQPAIYRYARQLLVENLRSLLLPGHQIQVMLILPEGQELAKRTSNEAFGVVEGLSLLGTTGISQPLSAPGQLQTYREELQQKAQQVDQLVFCVGENGLDLSQKLGINPVHLVKTANWLGPLLVEAGLRGVKSILLFGYHGKLLKLAGGIFHTHHHIADARLEILTAFGVKAGLPNAHLHSILASATAEAALHYLQRLDQTQDQQDNSWVDAVYGEMAAAIDQRTQAYIYTHSEKSVDIGTVLFDRHRQIIISSKMGATLLKQVCESS